MFEFLTGPLQNLLGQPSVWLFFLLFLVFILLAYRVLKLLMRAAFVAVIAGLFPVFGNMFLGLSIPVTLNSIIWFAMMGLEIYFVYHILVSIGKLAEIITKPFKRKKERVEKVIIREKEVENGRKKEGKEKD